MIARIAALGLVLMVGVSPAAAAGDVNAGAKTFTEQCAKCHGPDGKGDGPSLAKLHPKSNPVNWTNPVAMRQWSDAEIDAIIRKGGKGVGDSPVMPAYQGKLTDAQIGDLMAFIRSLAK